MDLDFVETCGNEIDSDDYMDVDEDPTTNKSSGKRSITPTQRKITANKMVRSKTKERKEGSDLQRRSKKYLTQGQRGRIRPYNSS